MRRALQIILPILFIAAGLGVLFALVSMSATADREVAPPAPLAVEIVEVQPDAHAAVVRATGTVQSATGINLVPQVAGRVVHIAKGLTPGSRFAKGDVIARIDARDYQANVTQAEANVTAAELDVALEEGRVKQAEREWTLLGKEASNPLATRGPQLQAARARLDAAKAALTTARLGLERTRLVAPFDAIVTAESLDVGQYVAPGAPVATLMGTDRFRVRVSIPVKDLTWLQMPDGDTPGSEAIVTQDLGNGDQLRAEGFVLRMLGELDAETRTAGVLVAIDDPLEQPEGNLPILPGAYVSVEVRGRTVPNITEVPRQAVVEGTTVWVADAEDRLLRRTVPCSRSRWCTCTVTSFVKGCVSSGA